jgi:carbon storage regulator
MLVLSRKKYESVVIGHGSEQIVISVVEIRGDRVRLGVTASPNIPVHRKEVHDVIHGTPASPATAEPVQRREART